MLRTAIIDDAQQKMVDLAVKSKETHVNVTD